MQLTKNTILITGGTSGIGLAFAERLSNLGNEVIVLGRSINMLKAVQDKFPNIDIYQADVSEPQTLSMLPNWIAQNHPNLNFVINSAGIMKPNDLLDPDVTVDELLANINVNLNGTIAVDKLLLPQLLNQPESMIVNISSGLANISSAAHPTYSASKAGIHMFTSALRDQLRFAQQNNIHIMELVPPLVAETNLESGGDLNAPGNMKLSDLIDEAIEGIKNNEIRVNAGAAKQLRKAGQTNPDETEWEFAKSSIPNYFPSGLLK